MPRIPTTSNVSLPRVSRPVTTHAAVSRGAAARDEQPAEPALSAAFAHDLDGHIAAASALAKSDGPEGTEALLNHAQGARAREAMVHASAAVRTELGRMLSSLAGANAVFARALLLRAIAARHDALTASEPRAREAVAVLARFCAAMDPLDASALKERASVLDLDSRVSTSALDPQQLWNTQGTVEDKRTVDDHADNDGLFQRFTGSCGATVVQMMLAENDPVFAFAIHEAGLTSDSTTDPVAQFQRALLDAYGGGKALGRLEAYVRARVQNGLGRLVLSGAIHAGQRDALRAHLFGGKERTRDAERALAALRERWHFPSDDEIDRLRSREWPEHDDGITTEGLLEIINERYGAELAPTHYEAREFAKGHAYRHLDDVARALKAGHDVPFGCSDPGHWLLLSAVDGRKPERRFLVSDPDGGRTVWVTERDFRRGTFLETQLHLARAGQKPWVDSFLLPRAAELHRAHTARAP